MHTDIMFPKWLLPPVHSIIAICEVHYEYINVAWLQNSKGEHDQPAAVTTRGTSLGSSYAKKKCTMASFKVISV